MNFSAAHPTRRASLVAGLHLCPPLLLAQTAGHFSATGGDSENIVHFEAHKVTTTIGRYTDDATPVAQVDLPFSVRVRSRAFPDDMRSSPLADAFRYVVGLNEQGMNTNAITLRGFSAASSRLRSTKVDGLAGSQSRFASPPTVNVERLEVIEGSTSIPCGQPNPGGLLNTVWKSPLAHAQTTLSVFASTYSGHTSSVGDANSLTTSFGSTGPIDRAGQWLYRIPASCEDRTSFRDYAVAPWHVPCIRPASFSLNWAEAHQSLSTPTGETPLRSPAQFARR
ncbi:MAG: TonB-dependent receptor plug domain-containing protein [Opitutae bacterium]|nr:TonB-dependent receptor plug domain-containing protein [Opitutae bacterium]